MGLALRCFGYHEVSELVKSSEFLELKASVGETAVLSTEVDIVTGAFKLNVSAQKSIQ